MEQLVLSFQWVFTQINLLFSSEYGETLFLIITVFCGFLFLYFLIQMIRWYFHKTGYVPKKYEKKILKISLPKIRNAKDQNADNSLQHVQEQIAVTETIFGSIGGLEVKKTFAFWLYGRSDDVSFEVVLKDGKVMFYVATPQYLKEYLQQQIFGQYPDAHIEEVVDYNIFKPESVVLGSYLTFRREYIFPIKTYRKIESDPMNAVLNTLTKFENDEGASIQFLIRSAPRKWHEWPAAAVRKMNEGMQLKDAIKQTNPYGFTKFWAGLWKFVKAGSSSSEDTPTMYKPSQMEEEAAKGIEEKNSKAGLEVNIRVVVASKTKNTAQMRLNDINNSFSQFNIYEYGNSFQATRIGSLKQLIYDYIHREINEKAVIILNTEELTSLFHFPLPSTESQNIDWLLAKKSNPPSNIPDEGIILGYNEYRGKRTEIKIAQKDRRRHMYVIGMTGTGKSWYSTGLALQDIIAGRGVCVVDPHGDLIDHLLAYMPKERAEDVILFDPANTTRPMGMNMLEYETPEQKLFVVDTILQIFDKLYDLKATGGPMFEQYMRNTLMLIMDDPETGNTLADVSKVLADEDFRKMKLSRCKTPVVKNFWEKEAEKAGGEASLQNMVPYITSKLTPFMANDLMRPIISQEKSSFSFRDAMDNEKIILCKLSKGKIGDLNANLLGMIFINKILMAALGRANQEEDQRKDFYLYIDEFQNFLTDSIEIILSEARKYRLSLTIAHQYLGQLVKNGDTKFKDAIFGNVGTKVSFRIGVDDAETMAKEFTPIFSEYDFLNVPKYNCFTKLLIDNANPPPFNMATYPFDHYAQEDIEKGHIISELSLLKYGRDRGLIENELKKKEEFIDNLVKDIQAKEKPPEKKPRNPLFGS